MSSLETTPFFCFHPVSFYLPSIVFLFFFFSLLFNFFSPSRSCLPNSWRAILLPRYRKQPVFAGKWQNGRRTKYESSTSGCLNFHLTATWFFDLEVPCSVICPCQMVSCLCLNFPRQFAPSFYHVSRASSSHTIHPPASHHSSLPLPMLTLFYKRLQAMPKEHLSVPRFLRSSVPRSQK